MQNETGKGKIRRKGEKKEIMENTFKLTARVDNKKKGQW